MVGVVSGNDAHCLVMAVWASSVEEEGVHFLDGVGELVSVFWVLHGTEF